MTPSFHLDTHLKLVQCIKLAGRLFYSVRPSGREHCDYRYSARNVRL